MSNTSIITSVAVSLGFPASFVHTGWSPVPTVTYKTQSLKSLKFEGKKCSKYRILKYNYNFIFTPDHISLLNIKYTQFVL